MSPLRAVILALLFTLPGCGRPEASASSPPPVNPAPAAAAPARPSLSVEVKSWDETQQLVAAQRGRVVVLDLWSTWCEPCLREFPNLVRLQRAHPTGLVCLAVNLDYSGAAGETPESCRENVQAFLARQEAAILNVLCRDAADEVFQRLKLGSIPAVLVYDRRGALVQRFDNDDNHYGADGFTYPAHIVPLVEKLLEKNTEH